MTTGMLTPGETNHFTHGKLPLTIKRCITYVHSEILALSKTMFKKIPFRQQWQDGRFLLKCSKEQSLNIYSNVCHGRCGFRFKGNVDILATNI